MQVIYEAILMIPYSPMKATSILNKMANQKLNFLELLKTMAIELYDRFQPKDSKSQIQYEQMSKKILSLLNVYIKTFFKQKVQNVYLYIQELYQWVVTILTCKTIALITKKVLVPAFTIIIDNLCFRAEKFMSLLDWVMANSNESASCMFVYIQALLDSKVQVGIKLETIQQSYTYLYEITEFWLKQSIEYYKYYLMQQDCRESQNSNNFITILKGNNYLISQICSIVTFLYNLSVKQGNKYSKQTLSSRILFSPKLAEIMILVLQIEQKMFDSQNKNLFGLNIIIANNLRREQKKIINDTKSLCLKMIKLILSISDKDFNLVHTDKILMSGLFELSRTIVEELCICSDENVINTLGEEVSPNNIICSLYEVWAEIVLFDDIKPTLMELNVQQLVRITMGFMKTREDEMNLFQEQPQEYFTLVYYILYGCMDEEQEEIDLSITQVSAKKSVVVLIKNLIVAASGYHSIMAQICCDYILLEMQIRNAPSQQLKYMFLSKYHLSESIFECLSLQACLFVFTVLLNIRCNEYQYRNKMRFILRTININALNELELCRVFVFLSVHAVQFSDHDLQTRHFDYIQKVFKLKSANNSVCKHGYYFLDRLVNCNSQYNHYYSIFIDKILHLAIDRFIAAKSPYLFEFMQSAMRNKQVLDNVVSLSWINLCLLELSNTIMMHFEGKNIQYEIVTVTIRLYDTVVKVGVERKEFLMSQPYQTLQLEFGQFVRNINKFLSVQLFSRFTQIVKKKQLISQQMQLTEQFNNFLFQLFKIDVQLTPESIQLLSNYCICILNRNEDLGDSFSYNNCIFQLLYQVINKSPFHLTRQSYQTINNWMKWQLNREGSNQIYINRVCIILQLIYYYLNGNIFQGQQYLNLFANVIHTIQTTFVKYLMDYQDFMNLIENQPDPDRRKINVGNIQLYPFHQQKKRKPVTIVRLYNTVLLSPTFDPKRIYLVKDAIKYYTNQTIPTYDLSVQILALKMILNKSRNSGVVECFRFALQILYYNSNHPQSNKIQESNQYVLKTLTQPLRSAISNTDPYNELFLLVNELKDRSREETVLMDYDLRLQDVEVDIIEFIKSDAYTRELVHKLSAIRRVNNAPRIIRKIKRDRNNQF